MADALNDAELLSLIKDYSQQLKSNPSSRVFIELAGCYQRLELLDSAISTLRQGLTYSSQNLALQLKLAELLGVNSEYDEAVALYDRIIEQHPSNVEPLLGLVKLDIVQANRQRALLHLDKARQLDPTHPQLAVLAEQLSNISNGAETSDNIPLMTATVAELYLKQGLKEKAINVYTALVQQQPDNEVLRSRLNELVEQHDNLPDDENDRRQVLDSLQRWLDAIELRRKHV